MHITRNQLRRIIQETIDADVDGNGIPDDQEDTMDPDDKVSMILNKVRNLLGEAYEIANSVQDPEDKDVGYAMDEVQSVVNTLHQHYGTEYWTRY